MIDSTLVILALALHTIFDFILQPREIARGKSESTGYLLIHCVMYTLGIFSLFGAFAGILGSMSAGIKVSACYALINGIMHFAIDAATSRISKHYYYKYTELKNTCPSNHLAEDSALGAFWTTIGIDQFLHISILLLMLIPLS